jgi:hypothetical protein
MQGGARFLRPVGKEGDAQQYCDGAGLPRRFLERWGGTIVIPPIGMQDRPFLLSRGEALILVLLLSLGLWAATWGAVALLALGGQW